jgi:hypothetical protein
LALSAELAMLNVSKMNFRKCCHFRGKFLRNNETWRNLAKLGDIKKFFLYATLFLL